MLKRWIKSLFMLLNREIPTKTLVKRGLHVGENFNRQQGCFIDPTHCYLIDIGDDVTMSIRVTLMAHDASTKKLLGYTKIGRIRIGNHVFIGANSTILPNVTIGDNVVIGAGSLVTHDIPANTVAAGVPAQVICTIEEYTNKNAALMHQNNKFDSSYRMGNGLTSKKKEALLKSTENGLAFLD